MPETKVFSKRIKEIRKALDKNQEEFAYDVGVSTEELSLIERGRTDVKLSTVKKFAAYTGYTVSQLLDVDEDQYKED